MNDVGDASSRANPSKKKSRLRQHLDRSLPQVEKRPYPLTQCATITKDDKDPQLLLTHQPVEWFYESIIKDQVHQFVEEHNILLPNQFGCRTRKSAIQQVRHFVYRAVSSPQNTDVRCTCGSSSLFDQGYRSDGFWYELGRLHQGGTIVLYSITRYSG